MITAIIFDLDNCLSPARQVGPLFEPAFAAIRAANRGTLSAAALDAAIEDTWKHSLDAVGRMHGFTPQMLAAGWEVLRTITVPGGMHGYGDLELLAGMPVARFLVTSGFRRLQESKIDALGIRGLFTAIHVDAIDEEPRHGKQALFARILADHRLAREQVLVVGDNPDSEIAAGNRLGLATVQTLRPGVERHASAKHHVTTLGGLVPLIGG
jgi:FMN phosphatase YigB (HAD superfamily)